MRMDLSSDSEPSTSRKVFKCTVPGCGASFVKSLRLISHTRLHTGERPFICNEPGCDKTYTNNSHLLRHKKVTHGEKSEQKVTCEFDGCGLVLANKYSLKKHYNNKHNTELYSFKCSECAQGFHRKQQLQKHLYLHTGEAPFSCDKCDRSFTTSYLLRKHNRSHREYTCDCGEIYHRWSLLLAHKKTCRKKEFVCSICDKTFSHAGNLKNHNLVHKNESEKCVFMCPYNECGRSYSYKNNLKYHINNFHKKINQNQSFKCTYPNCSVVLKTKLYLRRHLQRHFKWAPKKKRKPRWDKGIPRKSIISVLVGENFETTDKEDEISDMLEKQDSVKNVQISLSENIADDCLLEQCDLTLRLLNEKIVATN